MTTAVNDDNKVEIAATLMRISTLCSPVYDIRDKKKLDDYFYYSVLLEILIHLNDLLQKLKLAGDGITFTNGIPPTSKCKDVTQLVRLFRHLGCHNDKVERYNSKGFLYSSNIYTGGGIYADDITINTGDEFILVKGHIIKAYEMVLLKFANHPLLTPLDSYKWTVMYAETQGITM